AQIGDLLLCSCRDPTIRHHRRFRLDCGEPADLAAFEPAANPLEGRGQFPDAGVIADDLAEEVLIAPDRMRGQPSRAHHPMAAGGRRLPEIDTGLVATNGPRRGCESLTHALG